MNICSVEIVARRMVYNYEMLYEGLITHGLII